MGIDQTAAMALIADGLKSGDITGALAGAFEQLLDRARRSEPFRNGELPYRCWVLVDAPSGLELPNSPHMGMREHVEQVRATYRPDSVRATIAAAQRERPCVLLVCGCCKLPYGATEQSGEHTSEAGPDPAGAVHFESFDAAAAAGVRADWGAVVSHKPLCPDCVGYACPCGAARDYVDMLSRNRKMLKNDLWPKVDELRATAWKIRQLIDAVGQNLSDTDVSCAGVHADAEHELDQIERAGRALGRIVVDLDDAIAREIEENTSIPQRRLRDAGSEEPPF